MSVPDGNSNSDSSKIIKSDDKPDLIEEDTNDKSQSKMEKAPVNTTSEDSEYETLEEDNGGSSRSSLSRRSSFSDDLSDGIGLEDEREDGDGQEENSVGKDKKLDDDEDKRNPQYIPKKGTFYEHDDRTMVDGSEVEGKEVESNTKDAAAAENAAEAAGPKKAGGKVWTEKAEKWSHDLYNEDEQKPKSTQELIDTYGYDIRNEEAPPKARRRRRYGRGPNKYTRNWEDEEAYTRAAPQRRVFHNNKEEFPDLGSRGRNRDKPQHTPSDPPEMDQPRNDSPRVKSKSKSPAPRQSPGQGGDRDRPRDRSKGERMRRDRGMERGRVVKDSPPSNNIPPQPVVAEKVPGVVGTPGERVVGRGRGFRGTGKQRPTMEFTASRGRGPLPPAFNKEPLNNQIDDSLKHAAEMLVQDFSQIYVNNNHNSNSTNIVEETIIPRSERRDGGNRSKRYSTQRQRSLPETTPPPTYSPPHNIPYYTQPPPASYVPTPVYNDVTGQQVPMMAFLPPGPPPATPAAPPYPPPPMLNYLPPPAFPPIAMQPPQLPGQFEDPCGAEMYQGGITYYSPQSQSVVPRPNPPRRVKLAIPIVPPPDNKQPQAGAKQQVGADNKQEMQSVAT
ncbi:protein CASC3-like isoform X1 [Macrosteles quadrilineatus]|uniref:protein CASC3-like isoform X1 n=1 Tax=Macrosteles quadrilineatus TaxID=74068 RepID=UPI0023E1B8CB|nr:protein CASC3-like isoform X1 [Macrosteles quadrilineatus]XP_054290271.1 protein CASC3-like isoform X1 [Macrosteles quadrilineatus]